ncbi:MAG TPA: PIN domain-containing protein [Acidobacteriota bacterium]|mgnify:CR=1 FL=1|nr:PIN domain-containing protein [Acidobacteriota bacterium]HNT16921.1 PIN domain-containing protein [Acidobacteriota bacterium]HQO20301.1 PIN domain-containing protein [Acidobacteriota bacterium]HQQ46816.1 PIN domain-containing protein [Acidobacteriota bacterium]
MRVIVDTSIWSLALRRGGGGETPAVRELRSLISDDRVQMIGAVRQEILSGVREEKQFRELEARLGAFPDLCLEAEDHVAAARYFNMCRAKGIQGSNTDFLICAAAARRKMEIFTTDKDFDRYSGILPVALHKI